jgi:hypothetical protein
MIESIKNVRPESDFHKVMRSDRRRRTVKYIIIALSFLTIVAVKICLK